MAIEKNKIINIVAASIILVLVAIISILVSKKSTVGDGNVILVPEIIGLLGAIAVTFYGRYQVKQNRIKERENSKKSN